MLFSAIDTAINVFAFCLKFFRNSTFCKISFLLLGIIVAINSYYIFELRKEKISRIRSQIKDDKVEVLIRKTLNECGDLSFVTWSEIDSDHNLYFKRAFNCDKSKTGYDKDNCVLDIKFNNLVYLEKHTIDNDTLEFISNDTILPNQTVFSELTPVCFNILDSNNEFTDEYNYLRFKAPLFWSIHKRLKLSINQVCIIKVKDEGEQGTPIVYIFTLSFMPDSERSCNLEKTGKQEGDYLLKIARLAKFNLNNDNSNQ